MGLFGKAKNARQDAAQAAADAEAGGLAGALGGSAMGHLSPDVQEMIRYRDMAQRVQTDGIEAPAVINSVSAGAAHLGGSTMTVFEVTIAPADGQPYPATITQAIRPDALDSLTVGDAITVRYDPADRTSALIYSW
jgi:hypothetical protein